MMLPEIGKLYDQSDRELKTLYDNAGNVIWRSGLDRGTILWQGNQSVGWPGGPTLALSKPISETGEGILFHISTPYGITSVKSQLGYATLVSAGTNPTILLSKAINGQSDYVTTDTWEGVFTISDTTVNIFGRTGRYINLSQITAY